MKLHASSAETWILLRYSCSSARRSARAALLVRCAPGLGRLLLHPLLLRAAPADREAELLQVGDAVEVHEGASHDKHVEQLVGVELQGETAAFSWGSTRP